MDLSPEMASLADALIGANDQLLALYDLLSVTIDSLDETKTVTELLSRSQELLNSDALIVITADVTHFYGKESDREVLVDDLPDDINRACFAIEKSTTAFGLEAELRALRHQTPFSTGDRKLMKAVLQTVLKAVHTSRLHQQSLQQAIVAHDHHTAAAIAQVALPEHAPELAGIDFFARSDPARAAGGDLYAYAVVGNTLLFVVGDVSGKGVSAAMMMTTITSAANASFRESADSSPAEHLRRISQWTYDHLTKANLFTTLVVGKYCAVDGMLTVANAGHSPVVLVRDEGVASSLAHVPPVGVLPIEEVDTSTYHLREGEAIIVASDGLVEQENTSGEQFGEDALTDLLADNKTIGSAAIGEAVFSAIADFSQGHEQGDDRTLVIVKRSQIK